MKPTKVLVMALATLAMAIVGFAFASPAQASECRTETPANIVFPQLTAFEDTMLVAYPTIIDGGFETLSAGVELTTSNSQWDTVSNVVVAANTGSDSLAEGANHAIIKSGQSSAVLEKKVRISAPDLKGVEGFKTKLNLPEQQKPKERLKFKSIPKVPSPPKKKLSQERINWLAEDETVLGRSTIDYYFQVDASLTASQTVTSDVISISPTDGVRERTKAVEVALPSSAYTIVIQHVSGKCPVQFYCPAEEVPLSAPNVAPTYPAGETDKVAPVKEIRKMDVTYEFYADTDYDIEFDALEACALMDTTTPSAMLCPADTATLSSQASGELSGWVGNGLGVGLTSMKLTPAATDATVNKVLVGGVEVVKGLDGKYNLGAMQVSQKRFMQVQLATPATASYHSLGMSFDSSYVDGGGNPATETYDGAYVYLLNDPPNVALTSVGVNDMALYTTAITNTLEYDMEGKWSLYSNSILVAQNPTVATIPTGQSITGNAMIAKDGLNYELRYEGKYLSFDGIEHPISITSDAFAITSPKVLTKTATATAAKGASFTEITISIYNPTIAQVPLEVYFLPQVAGLPIQHVRMLLDVGTEDYNAVLANPTDLKKVDYKVESYKRAFTYTNTEPAMVIKYGSVVDLTATFGTEGSTIIGALVGETDLTWNSYSEAPAGGEVTEQPSIWEQMKIPLIVILVIILVVVIAYAMTMPSGRKKK